MDKHEAQYDPIGRSLLRAAGVLMILFGILGMLLYTLGLVAVIILNHATAGVFSAAGDLMGMSLLLAGALAELIAGILGKRAARKPERAGKGLIIWGLLCLLLSLAGMGHIALRAAGSALWWELALGLLLGVVTPLVYLFSANRLRKGPADLEEEAETE